MELSPVLLETIEQCRDKVVILSGCGGGYDVFGTLIYYHWLKPVAKKIILLNFCFTQIKQLAATSQKITPQLFLVPQGIEVKSENDYFPEAMLANHVGQSVYALTTDSYVGSIKEAYAAIIAAETGQKPDVLFLVDGGCDVLLTGDETGLATPVEDMMHLTAVLDLPISHKYILAIGTNVDCGHGVIQSELDDRLAALKKSGIMLYEQPLDLSVPAAQFYYDITMQCFPARTIVQSLVCAAMEGHRDYYTPKHLVRRIGKNEVPLTEQTCTLYGFKLKEVAAEVKYLMELEDRMGRSDVSYIVTRYQQLLRKSRTAKKN